MTLSYYISSGAHSSIQDTQHADQNQDRHTEEPENSPQSLIFHFGRIKSLYALLYAQIFFSFDNEYQCPTLLQTQFID